MDTKATAEDITEFLERLEADSLKTRLISIEQHYADKGESVPDVHRRSDTVQGFLTKEKITELFAEPDPEQLLIRCGLVVVSSNKAFFFSDDSCFGWKVLPNSFAGCSLPGLHRRFGPGEEFTTVDDILSHYGKGKRYLGSLEELAKYVLDRE